MAILNSYEQQVGPTFTFTTPLPKSYAPINPGPTFTFDSILRESYARIIGVADLDTTNVVTPRVTNYVQRFGNNEGDLSGLIYNSNGGAVALVSVEYSQLSATGPWLPLTVFPLDPLYNFPSPGAPGGTPFNIPVEITDDYTGNVWFKVEVSSPLPNTEDANGPFAFVFIDLRPLLPATVTVPEETLTGTYEITWDASLDTDYYELDEATESDFSDAVLIYSGTNTGFIVEDREEGTYYYRVRAFNGAGTRGARNGSNSIVFGPPAPPVSIEVPSTSKTGIYTIAWAPVIGATAYELQEDIDPNFANPKTIYSGPLTLFEVSKNATGLFYYRIRSRRD